jgi:uncharacterized protein
MLLVDAGPVVAMADRRDPRRISAREAIRGERGPLVIPAQVTAEIDYLMGERIGPHASLAFIEDLAAARFRVDCLFPEEYEKVADLSQRYAGLGLGLADLSLIVLADRFDCTRIATFDERHFRAVRPLRGGSFTILPGTD